MPAELKERMLESINFQTAYSLGENLASTWVDLAWHKISPDEVPSPYMAGAFEKEQLHNAGLLNTQIPPRYSTSYFNHVWGGGYAAGYYSYRGRKSWRSISPTTSSSMARSILPSARRCATKS